MPLGEIDTLLVLRLTGLIHIFILLYCYYVILLLLYSTGLCFNKVYNKLHFLTYIYIYIYIYIAILNYINYNNNNIIDYFVVLIMYYIDN